MFHIISLSSAVSDRSYNLNPEITWPLSSAVSDRSYNLNPGTTWSSLPRSATAATT